MSENDMTNGGSVSLDVIKAYVMENLNYDVNYHIRATKINDDNFENIRNGKWSIITSSALFQ